MLSLASLLNPAPPGHPPPTPRFRPSPALSSPATSYSSECPSLMFDRQISSSSKQSRMTKDTGGFVKSRAKGTVNYPPFENLDEACLGEMRHYQINPFGRIQDFCRHIPYNSGKKNFFDKTGRESFEVFQYTFKVPGDDNEYTVMWDYNVGLVRMTPFFKCCKYSKTQPAKMLNMNPGLRDITHSITGGSIMAQGYWMPFACAKAVCATFCASIAGALIPIFGPNFPLQCTPIDAPDHGRMVIDQAIVAEATREADLYRRVYANVSSVSENSQVPHHYSPYNGNHHHQYHQYYSHGPALPSPTSIPSPHFGRQSSSRYGSPQDYERDHTAYDGFSRLRRGADSPYGTTSEPEMSLGPETPSSLHHMPLSGRGAFFPPLSPPRSSGWTVVNNNNNNTNTLSSGGSNHHDPVISAGMYQHGGYREERASPTPSYSSNVNPLLSAIPRSGGHIVSSSSSSSSITAVHNIMSQLDQPREYSRHRLPLPPLSLATPTPTPTLTAHTAHASHTNIVHTKSSSPSGRGSTIPPPTSSTPKRPAADLVDSTGDYDDYDNHSGSSPTTTTTTATSQDEMEDDHQKQQKHEAAQLLARSGAEKNAALLLLNLRVSDSSSSNGGGGTSGGSNGSRGGSAQQQDLHRFRGGCGPESLGASPVVGSAVGGHRSKRRRATSM